MSTSTIFESRLLLITMQCNFYNICSDLESCVKGGPGHRGRLAIDQTHLQDLMKLNFVAWFGFYAPS